MAMEMVKMAMETMKPRNPQSREWVAARMMSRLISNSKSTLNKLKLKLPLLVLPMVVTLITQEATIRVKDSPKSKLQQWPLLAKLSPTRYCVELTLRTCVHSTWQA